MTMPITHMVSIYKLELGEGDIEAYELTPTYENITATIYPTDTATMSMYPGDGSGAAYQIAFWQMINVENGDKIVSDDMTLIVRGQPARYVTVGHEHIECVGIMEVGT